MGIVKNLQEAAKVYEERGLVYGEAWRDIGRIYTAMFPGGVHLKTPGDFERFIILVMCVSKLHRYSMNLNGGGHRDSAIDLINYAAILTELTEGKKKE